MFCMVIISQTETSGFGIMSPNVTYDELNIPLEIRSIPAYKLSMYHIEDLEELFDIMSDDQKQIIDKYMNDRNLSKSIILIHRDKIVDGNHRALAAALCKLSINSVDLSDLD